MESTAVGIVRTLLLFTSAFLDLCSAHHVAETAQSKRQASDLIASYDYIVVGAGTSELTVVDRLSKDRTSKFPLSRKKYQSLSKNVLTFLGVKGAT